MKPSLNNDIYRTVVLTILAGIAAVTVSFANRNVYTKDAVDTRIEAVKQRSIDLHKIEDERHMLLQEDIREIKSDLKWLIRNVGEINEAAKGNHTP